MQHLCKAAQILKGCGIHCKVDIVIHVRDIKEDGVEREIISLILSENILYHILISPLKGGLHPAKTPERRHFRLGTHNILILFYDIQS